MPTSEITAKERPLAKRAMPTRKHPRVHILILKGEDYEPQSVISIPRVEGDISKTFEAAVRTLPNMLNGWLRRIVVIHGDEVTSYDPPTFRWLCGAGPDPAGKDPNWMGSAADGSVVDAS